MYLKQYRLNKKKNMGGFEVFIMIIDLLRSINF